MQLIKHFADISFDDVALVGSKNSSLGAMYSALSPADIKIPNGFAITTDAYRYFLSYNQLDKVIDTHLKNLDTENETDLAFIGGKIRASIIHGKMPDNLSSEIIRAYEILEDDYGLKPDVAVRTSIATQTPSSSLLLGQQDSFLNVAGTRNLLASCKLVFASLFSDRAIELRKKNNLPHTDAAASVTVQKMVRSDQASSGVMFTIDTESKFEDVVLVTSSYGLGENVAQGAVNSDEFYVFKPTLEQGFKPLIKKHLGSKDIKMIYASEHLAGVNTKNISVHMSERYQFSISDKEALVLAQYASVIEKHYSEHIGRLQAMEIEWAKDGYTGELFIVHAKPQPVRKRKKSNVYETFQLRNPGTPLLAGRCVGKHIATGKARLILDSSQMSSLQEGEILVTDKTDMEWEPVLERAAAIVTNRGGRTCHAAIISREMGVPALVGCDNATEIIQDGAKITVSCSQGDTGQIYSGILPFDMKRIPIDFKNPTNTKIFLNLGNPELAMEASFLPVDGVGLARLEYIMTHSIKAHPNALLNFAKLDQATKNEIESVIAGYDSPRRFFIDKLAQGIGMIASAFYPRPVIVRFSDFKSNEYAKLIGGAQFEPQEENPALGMRGARRYFSEAFSESFELECMAINKVRNEMGLSNIRLLVPFVRSLKEAANVAELLARNGLKRSQDGLKIYLMCEVPSNALLASKFLEHFDGFSIGSNDLTQLTLGVDRDTALYSRHDERSEATQVLIDMAIEACKKTGKYIGICGQSSSDYKEFTKWLLQKNIDSISLNQDTLLDMRAYISELEQNQA